MRYRICLISLFIFGIAWPFSFSWAANILSDYKYAWSNNVGYINFEQVTVGEAGLSGAAWSKNSGWIKFDPTNGGVRNYSGNLSGYAWGDHLGWINFDNVSIDINTGKFSGSATGDLIGTLTFDCPNYCDVRTSWRGPSANISVGSPSSSNAPSDNMLDGEITGEPLPPIDLIPNMPNEEQIDNGQTETQELDKALTGKEFFDDSQPDQITRFFTELQKPEPLIRTQVKRQESYNAPLTVRPDNYGLLVWDFTTPTMFEAGQKRAVVVELPEATASNSLTITVQLASAELAAWGNQTELLGEVFSVTAVDEQGTAVHQLDKPIKITLVIPENLRGRKDLAVYSLQEGAMDWQRVPEVIFDDNSASFYVDHLTYFAIVAARHNLIISNFPWYIFWPVFLVLILIIKATLSRMRKGKARNTGDVNENIS